MFRKRFQSPILEPKGATIWCKPGSVAYPIIMSSQVELSCVANHRGYREYFIPVVAVLVDQQSVCILTV